MGTRILSVEDSPDTPEWIVARLCTAEQSTPAAKSRLSDLQVVQPEHQDPTSYQLRLPNRAGRAAITEDDR
jgi:hypothetical protein